MAREWVKVELYGANNDGQPVRYTIADGVSVSKGQVLYLVDPRAVSGAILGGNPIAGVAAEDKIANDGITSIACWTQGIFEVTASGAFTTNGLPFIMDSLTANTIQPFPPIGSLAASFAAVGGRALEIATADEVINVRLNL